MQASVGDRIVIHGHRAGEPDRDGEIMGVEGADGQPPISFDGATAVTPRRSFPARMRPSSTSSTPDHEMSGVDRSPAQALAPSWVAPSGRTDRDAGSPRRRSTTAIRPVGCWAKGWPVSRAPILWCSPSLGAGFPSGTRWHWPSAPLST